MQRFFIQSGTNTVITDTDITVIDNTYTDVTVVDATVITVAAALVARISCVVWGWFHRSSHAMNRISII